MTKVEKLAMSAVLMLTIMFGTAASYSAASAHPLKATGENRRIGLRLHRREWRLMLLCMHAVCTGFSGQTVFNSLILKFRARDK